MIDKPTNESAQDEDLVQQHVELLGESNASREGAELLPTWLIFGFLVLAFLGAGYLFWNSGGFSVNVFNPARVAWDGSGKGGAAAAPDPMVIGKRVFTQNCAVCHQQNGLGVPGQFPPLAGSEWVLAHDWHGDNHIVNIVLHGFHGAVNKLRLFLLMCATSGATRPRQSQKSSSARSASRQRIGRNPGPQRNFRGLRGCSSRMPRPLPPLPPEPRRAQQTPVHQLVVEPRLQLAPNLLPRATHQQLIRRGPVRLGQRRPVHLLRPLYLPRRRRRPLVPKYERQRSTNRSGSEPVSCA